MTIEITHFPRQAEPVNRDPAVPREVFVRVGRTADGREFEAMRSEPEISRRLGEFLRTGRPPIEVAAEIAPCDDLDSLPGVNS